MLLSVPLLSSPSCRRSVDLLLKTRIRLSHRFMTPPGYTAARQSCTPAPASQRETLVKIGFRSQPDTLSGSGPHPSSRTGPSRKGTYVRHPPYGSPAPRRSATYALSNIYSKAADTASHQDTIQGNNRWTKNPLPHRVKGVRVPRLRQSEPVHSPAASLALISRSA